MHCDMAQPINEPSQQSTRQVWQLTPSRGKRCSRQGEGILRFYGFLRFEPTRRVRNGSLPFPINPVVQNREKP
jgi:hypothetical protein